MKYLFILFILTNFLFGSVNDDYYLFKAQDYEKQNKIDKAIEAYSKIENKTDTINYNMANLYYKQNKFEQAINSYDSISDYKLKYKKLHNLGNAYAKSNKIDKAIESYEKALKIKDDKDTKNKNKIIKKQKKKQEKKKTITE